MSDNSKKRPGPTLSQFVTDLMNETDMSVINSEKSIADTKSLIQSYLGRRYALPNTATGATKPMSDYVDHLQRLELEMTNTPTKHVPKAKMPSSSASRSPFIRLPAIDYETMQMIDQPPGLNVALLDYQRQGVKWMMDMNETCILADEMGLGKTVQTIALMHASPEYLTLLVVPVSLIDQWIKEIFSKSAKNSFLVLKYREPAEREHTLEVLNHHVKYGTTTKIIVITTHFHLGAGGVLVEGEQKTPRHAPKLYYNFDANPLMQFRWSRIVIDEAHQLRNARSKVFFGACAIPRKKMILLTGTPVTNNVKDFQSLLAVLNLQRNPQGNYQTSEGCRTFDSTKESIVLRRYKGQVIHGRPITDIPKLDQMMLELELEKDSAEEVFYSAVEHSVVAECATLEGHSPVEQSSILLALINRLRQAACHPLVLGSLMLQKHYKATNEDPPKQVDWNAVITTCQGMIDRHWEYICSTRRPIDDFEIPKPAPILTWQNASSKVRVALQIVSDIMHTCPGEKVIIFSQFVSLLGVLQVYLDEAYDSSSIARVDGLVRPSKRAAILDRFKTDPKCRILLLSLKTGGIGLDLSIANHALLLDAWWNSAVESQAQDRVNRIGQYRPVKVYRFVVKDTVEERVELVKAKKDATIQSAFGFQFSSAPINALASSGTMTLQELRSIVAPFTRHHKTDTKNNI